MSERSIFLAALDIVDPAQRAAYLEKECGPDRALRRHIEELITAEAKLGGFLNRPQVAVELTDDLAPPMERLGAQIGPYKLMEQIGEGGFGLVFVAEQHQPVRRKVALKVIKPGMDTREVIARFEAERQALALMDHPHIAKVLDAGTTQSGRPYFVMELVRGVPITEYCDANHLTPRQRLELFVNVCQAVQHAHQKGVIHRDLKPTNILVAPHDGVPVVKVIDFGVAKALGQQLTEKTVYTRFAQMIGTPLYMSPEQAEINALDVDTRSDVYALGVLLYELLTGTTPFDKKRLASAAFDEIRRIIREEEPAKPSTRIHTLGETAKTISAQRKTEPYKLSQLLRNELDWIVMKALEKDRTRRYETASAFAADVGRYLRDEQVMACPPSLGYRLSKFTRRYKAPLAVAGAFVALLIVGIATSAWQRNVALNAAVSARQAKEAEAIERARAEANAKAAYQAEQSAVQEKNNALAAREELRETLYAAEMNLVQAAIEGGQYGRGAQLLNQQRPATGQSDLRGFEWHYWKRRLHHGRISTAGFPQLSGRFSGGQTTQCFSSDAAKLAILVSQPAESRTAAGTPDLLTIVSGHTGHEIVAPLAVFPEEQSEVNPRSRVLTMSGDGSRVAVALEAWTYRLDDRPGLISIRDAATGTELRRIQIPGLVLQIALTADGSRLAVEYCEFGSPDVLRQAGVSIWNTTTGELVQTLAMLPWSSSFNRIVWSPNGTRLLRLSVSVGGEGQRPPYRELLQIVDAASGQEIWKREYFDLSFPHAAWAWSPDGKLLATFEDRELRPEAKQQHVQVWDSDTGTLVAILNRSSGSPSSLSQIVFSPDGQRLAAICYMNDAYVWDVPRLPSAAEETPVQIPAQHLTLNVDRLFHDLAFSADGNKLHSIDAGWSLVTWDATARDETKWGPDSIEGFFTAAISSDVAKVAFSRSGEQRMSSVWDLTKNREVFQVNTVGSAYSRPAFSSDGRRVAFVREPQMPQENSQIVIHDAETGKMLTEIQVEPPDPAALRTYIDALFRTDGKQIAAQVRRWSPLQHEGPARLMAWDAETGKEHYSVPITVSDNDRVDYSRDGASLVLATNPRVEQAAAVFYNPMTGAKHKSIPLPALDRRDSLPVPGRRDSFSYWVHERFQVFGGHVGSDFVVSDLTTGQERLRLPGYSNWTDMDISPDRSRLVLGTTTSSARRTELSIWSLKSGRRLAAFDHARSLIEVRFSPDGNRLVGVFRDSSNPIQIWDATPLPNP